MWKNFRKICKIFLNSFYIFKNFFRITTIFFDFLQIISSENYYEKLFKNSKKLLKNMQNI